jgi:hypothetical protein
VSFCVKFLHAKLIALHTEMVREHMCKIVTHKAKIHLSQDISRTHLGLKLCKTWTSILRPPPVCLWLWAIVIDLLICHCGLTIACRPPRITTAHICIYTVRLCELQFRTTCVGTNNENTYTHTLLCGCGAPLGMCIRERNDDDKERERDVHACLASS